MSSCIKAAFHDTDILVDSPDTPTSLYVRHARFPRGDPRVDVGVSGESARMSASVSWNAALTHFKKRYCNTSMSSK